MTLTDFVLYTLYLCGASLLKTPSSRGVYEMFREADEALEQFNSRTVLNIINKLIRENFISGRSKTGAYPLLVSDLGKSYLHGKVPFFRKKRPWDEVFYLISFDIPESKRKIRRLLREKLKKGGAGLLQQSMWLSPYNPLHDKGDNIRKFSMDEWIIISKVNMDSIKPFTRENLPILMERIYRLDILDQRYKNYIKAVKTKSYLRAHLDFLDIVKDDPQLPFILEPPGFLAKKAYLLLKNLYI